MFTRETNSLLRTVEFPIFDVDGLPCSGETGEGAVYTLAAGEMKVRANGGSWNVPTNYTLTHLGDGIYQFVFAQAEVVKGLIDVRVKKIGTIRTQTYTERVIDHPPTRIDSVGGGTVNVPPSGVVITTGTEINTVADAFTEDQVSHCVVAVGSTILFKYTFVRANSKASFVHWIGCIDTLDGFFYVRAWNYVTLAWDKIGLYKATDMIDSTNASFDTVPRRTWALSEEHTDADGNSEIQFDTTFNNIIICTDRILVGYVPTSVDVGSWLGDVPGPLIGGRVDVTLGEVQDNASTQIQRAVAIATVIPLSATANSISFHYNGNLGLSGNIDLDDDTLVGMTITLHRPANGNADDAPQTRRISAGSYDLGTQTYTATVTPPWSPEPVGTFGDDGGDYICRLWPSTTGIGTATDLSAVLAAIAAVQVDTDDIQTRLPAALVDGRMDSTIGDVQSIAAPRVQSAVAIRTVQIEAIGADTIDFHLNGQMGDEANETLAANTIIGMTIVLECPSRTVHDGSYPQTRRVTAWEDLGGNLGRATVDRAWDPTPTGDVGPEGDYSATLWPAGPDIGIAGDVTAILALLHQNSMVDNQTYSGNDLTGFRLRKFADAAALAAATPGAADGADGEIYRFIGVATYVSAGKADMFTLQQVFP